MTYTVEGAGPQYPNQPVPPTWAFLVRGLEEASKAYLQRHLAHGVNTPARIEGQWKKMKLKRK
jgi:hypothetical protein